MKRNAIITIDETTAQVTKAFQRQARIFGTDEYKMWKAYREDFPGAKMETKTIRRNANKRTYRNLTYVNMGRYISVNAPQLFWRNLRSKRILPRPRKTPIALFWPGSLRISPTMTITKSSSRIRPPRPQPPRMRPPTAV